MKKLAVLCLCVLSFSACKVNKKQQSDSSAISKPNIIVVYLDDLGYGDVSAYGATELITPNFDRIAKKEFVLQTAMHRLQLVHQVDMRCCLDNILSENKRLRF